MIEENKNRIQYLDIIKFLAIFLVIFCHNTTLNKDSVISNILMLTCWCAVPCFFMTTGALFLNREFDLKKWTKRLIKTYIVLIIWKIIYFVFFILWNNIPLDTISKIDILKYTFLFNYIDGMQTGHMWFMNAYISILLIYPLILVCFNNKNSEYKKYFKILLFILIIVSFIVFDFNIILNNISKLLNKDIINIISLEEINPFGIYSNALVFFILGGILQKDKLVNKYSKRKIFAFSIIGIFLGIIILFFIRYSFTKTFTWDEVYLANGYNYIATLILSVSVFVLIQTMNLKTNSLINIIAKNTLGIFYIHIIILIVTKKWFITYGVFSNVLKTIITLIISTIICYIMKKIVIIKEIF